ncbi:uncharacterized protein TNCV_2910181 [Trichonephila clavipes]|nr:uncharacterized protein TNCV_2910181 [Trichonephila clavipes]
MQEGCGRQNGMNLSLLTSHASVCNTTMVGFESGDSGERGRRIAAFGTSTLVLHRVLWYGVVLDITCAPLVRIAGTLTSQCYISEVLEPVVLPYLQGLATAIFQQDSARPHVACIVQRFFVNRQIELLPLAGLLSGSFADRKHVVHGCSKIDPDYTPSCHTRSTLATCGSCLVCCTPRIHPKYL